MNIYERVLGTFGLIIGVLILSITLPKLLKPAESGLPKGFKLPGVALEWTKSPDEAKQLIQGHPNLENDLKLDTRYVILIYVLYYLALAWFLKTQGGSRETYLAMGVAVCIIAAGIFDLRENHFTREIMDNVKNLGEKDVPLLTKKYWAYVAKWGLIAIVLALIGIMLIWRGSNFAGGFNLLAALVFLAGLTGDNFLTEWGFSSMGIGLLLLGVTFLV